MIVTINSESVHCWNEVHVTDGSCLKKWYTTYIELNICKGQNLYKINLNTFFTS